MTGSGSSSRWSSRRTSSSTSSPGARSTWRAGGPSRASTSRSPSSARALAASSSGSSACSAGRRLATEPFLLEPVRYRETRSVGMLVLDDPSGRATTLAERVQRRSRAPRRVRARASRLAARTSRSCASASARGSTLRCRTWRRSLRPAPLLSFHVCTRQGRGTRSWSRVRLEHVREVGRMRR